MFFRQTVSRNTNDHQEYLLKINTCISIYNIAYLCRNLTKFSIFYLSSTGENDIVKLSPSFHNSDNRVFPLPFPCSLQIVFHIIHMTFPREYDDDDESSKLTQYLYNVKTFTYVLITFTREYNYYYSLPTYLLSGRH